MRDKITEQTFNILKFIGVAFPVFLKKAIAKAIAYLFYKFHKKYYKVAKSNLDFIYEDNLNNREKEQFIKNSFYHLAQNFGSFIENQGISKEKLLKKVEFIDDYIFKEALNSGKAVVLITAHLGNWEILPLAISAKYQPLVGVGRKLKQPWLDRVLRKNREQFGIEMVDKNGGMKAMVKVVRDKKLLGLLIDQSLPGVDVEFFGKKVSHTTAAALLARKFDALVLPCFIERVGFERYKATFYKPIEMEKTDNIEKDILTHTQKQAKITEDVIKKYPQQWLWIHRRWKKYYKNIYE